MSASAPAAAAPTTAPAKLDDLMLAMDVVDTLRHRERLVERELDEDAKEEQLIERLRAENSGLTGLVLESLATYVDTAHRFLDEFNGLRRTRAAS